MCKAKNEIILKLGSEGWLWDARLSIKGHYKKLQGEGRTLNGIDTSGICTLCLRAE